MPDAVIGIEFGRSALPHHLTALKNGMPVG